MSAIETALCGGLYTPNQLRCRHEGGQRGLQEGSLER